MPGGCRWLSTPELLPVLADAGVVDAGGAGYLLLLDAALHVLDGEPLPEPRAAAAAGRSGSRPSSHEPHRRQRAALRGDVLLRPRRRAHRGAQAGVGRDRRLHRRRRRRRDLELPRTHQRHRCGDRGSARPRRPAPADPRHRPVRGDRRRTAVREAELVRSSYRCRRRAARGHVCGRRGQQRAPGISELFRRARRAGHRQRGADDESVDGGTARGGRARQRRPGGRATRATRTSSRSPSSSTPSPTQTVRVVPTRSMPEGLAALMAYDPEAERRGQHARRCGWPPRTSPPVRSPGPSGRAGREAGPVAEGGWMASSGGDGIVAVSADLVDAATALLERLVAAERELVTVLTGVDADDGDDGGDRRVAGRRPSRRRGGGARRRPAAVPVPVRRGMTRMRRAPTRRPNRSPCRELGRRSPSARLKGVGERKRTALAALGHRDRARSADHVPASVGRPHQRGPGRPTSSPERRRSCWSTVRSAEQANRPQPADDRRDRRRRRERAHARRVLQPAVA